MKIKYNCSTEPRGLQETVITRLPKFCCYSCVCQHPLERTTSEAETSMTWSTSLLTTFINVFLFYFSAKLVFCCFSELHLFTKGSDKHWNRHKEEGWVHMAREGRVKNHGSSSRKLFYRLHFLSNCCLSFVICRNYIQKNSDISKRFSKYSTPLKCQWPLWT